MAMTGLDEIAIVALLGLLTTSSSIAGAAMGLYAPLSKRMLACVLAFAAGALISALAIDLAFEGATELHQQGFRANEAWAFVGSGFALGAIIYYFTSLFLDQKGAAIRNPTRFREYALGVKQKDAKDTIRLLSKCDLLRHLPPEEIENLLPCVRPRHLEPNEILFRAGDTGDALYIVAHGKVEVLSAAENDPSGKVVPSQKLAELGEGKAFGEMALLSGLPRTATIQSSAETELLEIGKEDFDNLLKNDHQLASAVRRLSHERAISNLSSGGSNPSRWVRVATSNLDHVSRDEAAKILAEAGHGAGLAIVLGNILDTIPGCLVIGAKFAGLATMSVTLIVGMFVGGIPEAAASAAMLKRAGYSALSIFALWSTVLVAGMVAAAFGKAFIGSGSHLAIFFQALAGGAVLALVAHAMIPESIHEGGSLIVLPTVAGFIFALWLALAQSLT
ncbi:MAG TPA: cyclic nucleotide-binding domain-containing protein [Candidatus Binataceae bacterium]|nr:cyclic nucleotide-binding domain-containing protein [Candidatus Binataceae bacterium]